jgi:3-deoxy-D-manno-octulosonate 8-phosphate phosphatase (KDO 8-P phosphatase)
MAARPSLHSKLHSVRMLLLDVDGVMTDGGLYYSAEGVEMKRFHAHDGFAVVRALDHGLRVGIISGRSTPIVDARARVLHITDVYQGSMDKVAPMRELQKKYALREDEFAFMGDELFDIPLLKLVGFSAGPKNARPEVKRIVDYVTKACGGDGAVREVIDLILAHQRAARNGPEGGDQKRNTKP